MYERTGAQRGTTGGFFQTNPRVDDIPDRFSALHRGIRRWDLVALVLNAVIGAGIFGLPARVFDLAGNWSLVAFGGVALIALGSGSGSGERWA